MKLKGKHILLGVCGGIAAYKIAYLIRLLSKEGAEVKVIMTPQAVKFIGPLTFSVLSKNPVAVEFYNTSDGTWTNHVELGLWADIMLIAPATANTIAKMATGICDTVLLAAYLSAKCPVSIFPAMDVDMWRHTSTQKNITQLKKYGHKIIEPVYGELASGLTGEGRLPEPAEMLNYILGHFKSTQKLVGKKILITAGPTFEKIDPVRYIGNFSSGKMGFALADAFETEGADVTLIHGPVNINSASTNIKKIAVTSAEEMYSACAGEFDACDIFISAAAVADFTPVQAEQSKIKKTKENENGFQLTLRRTKDILAEFSKIKKKQIVVGFALETDNELENARKKLQQKNLDMLILNSMQDSGSGFMHDTNKITILDKNNNVSTFELKTKPEVAKDIIKYLIKYMYA